MNRARLYVLIAETTMIYRKGERVEGTAELIAALAAGKPAEPVRIYAYPHVSEAPPAHVLIDMAFVMIGVDRAKAAARQAELIALLSDYPAPERLAAGPSYIELGATLGSQAVALRLMALGQALDLWHVITPETFGYEADEAMDLAGKGLVMISGFDPREAPAPPKPAAHERRPPLLDHQLDPITVPPSITGPRGKAWQADTDALYERHHKPRASGADVATWIIEAPWAHPAWHSYILSVVHLRPLPQFRSPTAYLPGATHELALYALDPRKPNRQAVIEGQEAAARLVPMNFAAQIIAETDAAAIERVLPAITSICHGILSPDTDFIRVWASIFGDNMMLQDQHE